VSDDTVDPAIPLIKGFEGYRSEPYPDVNHLRLGYGSDTITMPDGTVKEVQPGMKVTQDDAHRDLTRRVGVYQSQIKDSIGEEAWNKLTPQARASLTSVAYNYGHLPYRVQTAATSGDLGSLASAISGLSSDNNGVNAKRRLAEANNVLGIGAPGGQFGLGGVTPSSPLANAPIPGAAPPGAAKPVAGLTYTAPPKLPAVDPSSNGATVFIQSLLNAAQSKGGVKAAGAAKAPSIGGDLLKKLFGGAQAGGVSSPGPVGSPAPAPTAGVAPPPPPGLPSLALQPGGTFMPTALVEGRSVANKLPDAPESAIKYNFGGGTEDSMPTTNAATTADRMPTFGDDPTPKRAPPLAVLGGRGNAPLMMPSSPPESEADPSGSTYMNVGPSPSSATPRNAIEPMDWQGPVSWDKSLPLPVDKSAPSTYDLPAMLQTLFGQ
jgi:GH24 family phage-related lysozyme (muramidase)